MDHENTFAQGTLLSWGWSDFLALPQACKELPECRNCRWCMYSPASSASYDGPAEEEYAECRHPEAIIDGRVQEQLYLFNDAASICVHYREREIGDVPPPLMLSLFDMLVEQDIPV